VNSGEYKVMGLAPYGEPRFKEFILRELIDLKEDGSFRLNIRYFDYLTGLRMTNRHFDKLFGGPPRSRESELTQRHMDIAASVQAVLEEAVIRLARTAQKLTGEKKLCLAGGVALNAVANGKLLRQNVFSELWVQPAAGDSGGAIGAALSAYHQKFEKPRLALFGDGMQGALLGPSESSESARDALLSLGARFKTLTEDEILERTADSLARGLVVGWHSGRMEFGPRALGGRSILADPRNPQMRELLNQKIKLRESFRPFAPAVPVESVDNYFGIDRPSSYMLFVTPVNPGQELPAVTHVDNSARIQTVDPKLNPRFHSLLKAFGRKTGLEVLVNTSFNVRGEPLVNTATDSYRCFMHSGLDVLVIENHWLEKKDQPEGDWQREISLD
jgi:carbamoyltransferase